MEIFKGQKLPEFCERFKRDQGCKEYFAHWNWEESATAQILFHKVKFCVRKAFFMCFVMSTSTKSLPTKYINANVYADNY